MPPPIRRPRLSLAFCEHTISLECRAGVFLSCFVEKQQPVTPLHPLSSRISSVTAWHDAEADTRSWARLPLLPRPSHIPAPHPGGSGSTRPSVFTVGSQWAPRRARNTNNTVDVFLPLDLRVCQGHNRGGGRTPDLSTWVRTETAPRQWLRIQME